MTKDERIDNLKNKISMALKDPILQLGFEIICKNLSEPEEACDEIQELLDKQIEATYKVVEELNKAKELLREFVKWANWQGNSKCPSFKNIQDKAEAFLKKETEQTCSNCKHYAKNYELCCYSLGDEDYDCRGRKWEKVED